MARLKRIPAIDLHSLRGRLTEHYEKQLRDFSGAGVWAGYLQAHDHLPALVRALRAGDIVKFYGWQVRRFVPPSTARFYLLQGDSLVPVDRHTFVSQ